MTSFHERTFYNRQNKTFPIQSCCLKKKEGALKAQRIIRVLSFIINRLMLLDVRKRAAAEARLEFFPGRSNECRNDGLLNVMSVRRSSDEGFARVYN